MIAETFEMKVEGSQPGTRMDLYRMEYSKNIGVNLRPLILMCPGGGYNYTSDRESDPIAVHFLSAGYHVAILRYSCNPAVFPTALLELAEAMKLIHAHAKEWHVDTDKIVVQGCSAGGHLAASLGVFWHEKWLAEKADTTNDVLGPAGMLLCYPVITSGKYAHRGSFESLLRGQYTEEMLERTSLEKQVSEYTPKAFIWHTYTDKSVPVQNSLLLIEAMKEYEIPVEFHMYPVGDHGLATCDKWSLTSDGRGVQEECQSWLPLAKKWLSYF